MKNKQKQNLKCVYITNLHILLGVSGLTVGTSLFLTRSGTSIDVSIGGCTKFLASVATSITNEHFSEPKHRCTKLKDRINIVTILHQKVSNENNQIDIKIDDRKRF